MAAASSFGSGSPVAAFAALAVRRLLWSVPVVLLATVIVFGLVSLRGDPLVELRQDPSIPVERIEQLEAEYHLDDALHLQYGRWLVDFVRGRWGTSYQSRLPVRTLVAGALPNTLLLVGAVFVVSTSVAVGAGVLGASREGSTLDHVTSGLAYFGISMPVFWFGLILQLVLVVVPLRAFDFQLFYVQGKYSTGKEGDVMNLLQHMALPVLTLSIGRVAVWSRFQRAGLIEALDADYVRTATAKGATRHRVIVNHALRNSLGPMVTVVALGTAAMIGGAVVTERIFAWPGMGTLFVSALQNDDYPVILSWLALVSVGVVGANLLADMAYRLLDPRVRLT